MPDKKFVLVLHSHIPYVLAHGSWPHGMDWLYEAAAESYLPLLRVFRRLEDEGIHPGINIGFTPVLAAQLKDPRFKDGFRKYLAMKIGIAAADGVQFSRTGDSNLQALAAYWKDWYERVAADYHNLPGEDIVDGFRALQDRGSIEILTSAATHGYFPLLARDESIRHQIRQGCHTYRAHFGREPKGFWLPECAYRPAYDWQPPLSGKAPYPRLGVDEILGSEGIGFFFVDGHLLKGGEAKGVYLDRFPELRRLWEKAPHKKIPAGKAPGDPYSAYLAYPSNTPFFVRDEVSGAQVWSRFMGYPGDGAYLEFHKKHFPGGMRYWRITSGDADLGDKLTYSPAKTKEKLAEHARHFIATVEGLLKDRDEAAVVVSLYDTELFGHWWFEGPEWLYLVLKGLSRSSVVPATGSSVLESMPPQTVVSLPEGSWGQGGFHWIWLNDETSWIWEDIYRIEDEAARLGNGKGCPPRLLKQFFREKFLLESSDWPFLISTVSAGDYARTRATEHFDRALALARLLRAGEPLSESEEAFLKTCETEDDLFEEVVRPDGQVL
jgi:1,4-alpha-glucan branching enzyme